MTREAGLSRYTVIVITTGVNTDADELSLLDLHRSRDHHRAVVCGPTIAFDSVKTTMLVCFPVDRNEQSRGRAIEGVQAHVRVTEEVSPG